MIARELKIFIVKALARYDQPMAEETLRSVTTSAFAHVALTAGDLGDAIKDCEDDHLIAGTNDTLLGPVWTVTAKGKIRAQQLR